MQFPEPFCYFLVGYRCLASKLVKADEYNIDVYIQAAGNDALRVKTNRMRKCGVRLNSADLISYWRQSK